MSSLRNFSVLARQGRYFVNSGAAYRSVFAKRYYGSEAPAAAQGSFLNKDEVTQRVISVIQKHEKVDAAKVSPNSHFANDLGLDSLDSAEVVMEVENEFAVEIPDEEAFKLQTVGDCVHYISQNPLAK